MGKVKLSVIAAIAALAVYAADNAQALQNARRRIVARSATECEGCIVLTYVQGTKTWKETNTIHRVAVKLAKTRYSKLKLIQAAKEAGKWDEVKSFISAANLTDEWQACQYIEEGNPAYVSATNQVISSGIATDAQVKAFIEKAKDED